MPMDPFPARTSNFSIRSGIHFLLVGGFATALHYLLTAIFSVVFKWPLVESSAIGFSISAIVNYFLNARFTFESKKPHKETFPRFFAVAGVGLLINTIVLTLLISIGLGPIISQTLSTCCVIAWNYSINSIWTFKKAES
ncbi:GtrA family protein [Stenotrophomonas sp. YIM B06876]|uniref:GtrA family protein n=1 Tax=Stenotrophomonas sp. YIM B06876 TaxID=3060211 RepID=UPI002739C28A|nr:GtrA family protein [Stenotrophomonas sp. YIM B06876]